MDKLQPILKQKYWICFGLSLIFVLFGWWNASGDLATKTAERKTAVEGSFSKAGQGATDPNESWVVGGKKENELDKGAYKTASLQLWKRQQSAREWPEQIRNEMQKSTYFNDDLSKETRERWASVYQSQIEELLKIVQPVQYDTGEGLVVVDANRITRQPYDSWRNNKPTSKEIWSNQEDIWLLKALLTSISKTNDSSTRIAESQVREIKRLHLRGGDRKTKAGAVGAKAGGLGGPGGMGAGGGESVYAGMGAGMAPGGAATGNSHPGTPYEGKSGADILTEEFGAVAGAAGGGMGMGMGMSAIEGYSSASSSAPGGLGGPKSAAKKEVRYVDDAEKDQGYKTRAFLLDVLIRDERLPDLLATLTNSDFPVEIVRVEVLSRAAGMGGGGMGGGGMGGGGMGGGGMGGGGMSGYGGGMGENGGEMSSSSGGLGGGFPGGSGMMSPGMGGGFDSLSGGNGTPGISSGGESEYPGAYPGETSDEPGLMGGANGAMKGREIVAVALADPLLIEVRIGGLLTLYMTPEESETQAKTEEKSEKEAAKAKPVIPGSTSSDGLMVPGSETQAPVTTNAAEGSIVVAPADRDSSVPPADGGPVSGDAAAAPVNHGVAGGGTPTEPSGEVPSNESSPTEPSGEKDLPATKAP